MAAMGAPDLHRTGESKLEIDGSPGDMWRLPERQILIRRAIVSYHRSSSDGGGRKTKNHHRRTIVARSSCDHGPFSAKSGATIWWRTTPVATKARHYGAGGADTRARPAPSTGEDEGCRVSLHQVRTSSCHDTFHRARTCLSGPLHIKLSFQFLFHYELY